MAMINYELLHKSIEHYRVAGDYQRIETPWLVTKPISDITKPLGASTYMVKKDDEKTEKVFVASAEQGFLYMINKGQLPAQGKFQSITPCMRNDSFDIHHTKYFLKNELINYTTDIRGFVSNAATMRRLDMMIMIAREFFQSLLGWNEEGVTVEKTGENSYDIMLNGVEIGSYGIRTCDICTWIYGTGLAEPRFSTVARKYL
jgi:hypothetical protein